MRHELTSGIQRENETAASEKRSVVRAIETSPVGGCGKLMDGDIQWYVQTRLAGTRSCLHQLYFLMKVLLWVTTQPMFVVENCC